MAAPVAPPAASDPTPAPQPVGKSEQQAAPPGARVAALRLGASVPGQAEADTGDAVVNQLVSEFLEEQQEEAKVIAVATRKQLERTDLRPPYLAVAAVACLAAWLAPLPGTAPKRLSPPTAQFTMASGRLALNLAARRIDAFVERHGRLPTVLADANVWDAGMELQRINDADYVLRLKTGTWTLMYDSQMAPAIQVEDQLTIVRTTHR